MRANRRKGALAGAAAVLLALTAALAAGPYRVKWVPDGDTILLTDGRFVRYIGINAPEVPRDGVTGEPMGTAARRRNRELIGHGGITLEYDRTRKDRYDRTLGYVFNHQGRMINEALIAEGLAWCLPVSPNEKHRNRFLGAQQKAMMARSGMWRRLNPNLGGMIGNRRSLRFHRRGCPNAGKMSKRNREHFTSAYAAFYAGYAPAKNCLPPAVLFSD